MKHQLFIVDDFYEDPDSVRKFALEQPYTVEGNYPGLRTGPSSPQDSMYLKKYIEANVISKSISYWGDGYNTAFQYTTEANSTWVHHDETQWAGIVYLSPNPPENSGTTMYSHKETGIYDHSGSTADLNNVGDAEDLSKWKKEIEIENRYNRLIIYNGLLYHRSTNAGFGQDLASGRLFQTFFFDTE